MGDENETLFKKVNSTSIVLSFCLLYLLTNFLHIFTFYFCFKFFFFSSVDSSHVCFVWYELVCYFVFSTLFETYPTLYFFQLLLSYCLLKIFSHNIYNYALYRIMAWVSYRVEIIDSCFIIYHFAISKKSFLSFSYFLILCRYILFHDISIVHKSTSI